MPVTPSEIPPRGGLLGQFQLDGANAGSLDTTSPYAYSWNTSTASNGSHTVRAIAKDAAGFATYAAEHLMNITGARAIELVLHLLKDASGRLEQYYTSADVLDDHKNVVAYSAIIFEKK